MGTIINEAPEFHKVGGRSKGADREAIESLEVGQWYIIDVEFDLDPESDLTEDEQDELSLKRAVANARSKATSVSNDEDFGGKFSVKRTADNRVAVGRTA